MVDLKNESQSRVEWSGWTRARARRKLSSAADIGTAVHRRAGPGPKRGDRSSPSPERSGGDCKSKPASLPAGRPVAPTTDTDSSSGTTSTPGPGPVGRRFVFGGVGGRCGEGGTRGVFQAAGEEVDGGEYERVSGRYAAAALFTYCRFL